jgi:prepilin-type N-terminal cleavage/methylation domain-containing protein
MMKFKQAGFTLVEIAIVLMIVTILLGYSVALFPVQQELKQYRQVETEMDGIIEQLMAFGQVNGRLPCPDTDDDGEEDRTGGPPLNSCVGWFGRLPARTLGINGKYSANGRLLDPWGEAYGYAVSAGDGTPLPLPGTANGDIDLVTANGIRDQGMADTLGGLDLFICDDSDTLDITDTNCTDVSGGDVIEGVAAVVISMGKNNDIPATSNIQAENLDDFGDGTNDKVYIFAPRSDNYDDVVKWIPANLLFSRMIKADQLP